MKNWKMNNLKKILSFCSYSEKFWLSDEKVFLYFGHRLKRLQKPRLLRNVAVRLTITPVKKSSTKPILNIIP